MFGFVKNTLSFTVERMKSYGDCLQLFYCNCNAYVQTPHFTGAICSQRPQPLSSTTKLFHNVLHSLSDCFCFSLPILKVVNR